MNENHRILRGLAFLLLLGLGDPSQAFDFFQPVDPPRPFQLMVHRGMKDQAPENTRPALEMLIEDRLEWAEVDLRRTRDGQHIVFHDSRLEGKTNGKGRVDEHTLEEIQNLDAGSWFSRRFRGTRILSLPECLDLARGRLNLYLDCKDVDPVRLVREIRDSSMERQVAVFADLSMLDRIKDLSGGRIAVIAKWRPEYGIDDWVAEHGPDIVEINADRITEDLCEGFHRLGVQVQVKVLGEWDRSEFWGKGLEWGVDFFQTDRPGELLAHWIRGRFPDRHVMVSLHRGASRYAPENSFPAFDKALRLGTHWIEVDVRASRDGHYFLLHDATLDRTTDGKGPISEQPSDRIRMLDAGSWFGKPFAGTRVPSFEEFLEKFSGKVRLYCDAKAIPPEDLVRFLKRYRLVDRSVVYQNVGYLSALKAIEPGIRALAPLHALDDLEDVSEDLNPHAFDVSWTILSQDLVERCHQKGIQVFIDLLGERDRVEHHIRAMRMGVDLIQTDRPLVFMRALELCFNSRPPCSSEKGSAGNR